MTYIPELLNILPTGDVIRVGAEKINRNFSEIAQAIEAAASGITYLDSVLSIESASPTTGAVVGYRYIVDLDVLESDAWGEHPNAIAELTSTSPYTWEFSAPESGWAVIVEGLGAEYIFSNDRWIQRSASVTHNDLLGIDGSTYHVTKDTYDALAGTGTPSASNRFVTADTVVDGGTF